MSWTNELQTLKTLIEGIVRRVSKLETSYRFNFPPVSSDPAHPRKGDAWLNTTSNTFKGVDATGAVKTFTVT